MLTDSSNLSLIPQPLSQQQQWFQEILGQMKEGVRVVDPFTLNLIYLNASAAEYYHRNFQDSPGQPQDYLHCVVPQDRDRVSQILQGAIRTRQGELEYSILLPNGETCRLRDRYWLTTDEAGNPLSLNSLLTPLNDKIDPYHATETASLNTVAQNMPGTIYQYLVRPDGTEEFIYLSPSLKRVYELEPQQVKENPQLMWEIIHPEDILDFQKAVARSTEVGQEWQYEWRVITHSGQVKWINGTATPSPQPNGNVIWEGLLIDITERKQAEEERDRFFTINLDLLCIAGTDGYFKELNPVWETTLGYTKEELCSIPFIELVHPEDQEKTLAEVAKLSQGEITIHFENRYRCKDGSYKWLAWTSTPFLEYNAIYASARDITEQKAIEQERQNLITLIENSSDFIGICSLEGIPEYLNPAGLKMVGLDPNRSELQQVHIAELIAPEDRDFLENTILPTVMQTGEWHGEFRFQNVQTQKIIPVDYHVYILRNPHTQEPLAFATITRDITQKKEAEQERQILITLIENTEDFVGIARLDGHPYYINPAGLKMVGLESLEEAQTKHINDFLIPADAERQQKEIVPHVLENNYWQGELNFRHFQTGETIPVDYNLFRIDDHQGEIFGVGTITRDIRERKQAEAHLRDREQFFSSIYNGVTQAIFTVDITPEGFRYAGWNPTTAQLLRVSSTEGYGKAPEDIFSPEQAQQVTQHYMACIEAKKPLTYEECLTLQDQETWLLTTFNPIFDTRGNVYRIVGTVNNITERKQAEIALRKQEQFLRSIYDGIEQSLFILQVTPEGDFIYESWNRAMLESFGFRLEDIQGKTPGEVFGEKQGKELRAKAQDCVTSREIFQEERLVTIGDQSTWLFATLYPLSNETGQIYRIIGTITNITEQKQAELILQQQAQQEALLNRLIDRIRQSLDLETILETAVQEIYQTLDIDRAYFIWYVPDENEPVWQIVKEAKKEKLPSILGTSPASRIPAITWHLQEGKQLRIDNIDNHHEPEVKHFFEMLNYTALLALPVQTQSGRKGAWVIARCGEKRPWQESEVELMEAVATQLTLGLNQAELYQQTRSKTIELEAAYNELQQAQTQLIQSEKMSSLGQLVAGVAHEINNPVNFIYGNISHAKDYIGDLLGLLEMYQETYPESTPEIQDEIEEIDLEFLLDDLPKMLDSMKFGSDRIKEIVKSLRTFSRLDESEMKAVNLHDNIDSTLMILHNRIKAKSHRPDIQVIQNYGDLPLVECYAGQLNQVFMNLISNAIDALEEKSGNFSYAEIEANPNRITITTEVKESQALIKIADNGTGIPEAKVNRIFDPFFTTKDVGKGTGLGLSISYQIVTDKHKGQLSCSSGVGQGTEFIIAIPLKQE